MVTPKIHLPGHPSGVVSVVRYRSPDDPLSEPQPTSSFQLFSQSFGLLCSSSSYTTSSDTLSYPVNGVAPVVLKLGIAELALVRWAQVAGSIGSVVGTTVVLHHLPHRTQRVDLPRPSLKVEAVAPAFGRVWLQEV